jgi:putative transposase
LARRVANAVFAATGKRVRRRIGRIFHQLCLQKEVGLIEGHAMPDHVHMVLSIPPKHSVSSVLGYLKGKSAIMIHREMERVKHGFTGKHFWAQGVFCPHCWPG